MNCIWNIKPEERQCQFCVVEGCKDRLPKQPKTITNTQGAFVQVDWSDA